MKITKPEAAEHAPYFQSYIDNAAANVVDDDLVTALGKNQEETMTWLFSVPEELGDYRYADEKWTFKEVLIHLMDVERVMAYRALVASRCDDKTILPGFDDKAYVAHSRAAYRSLKDLIVEFLSVRNATLSLFHGMHADDAAFIAKGERAPFSARACGYIILGHTLHHVAVLKERYYETTA